MEEFLQLLPELLAADFNNQQWLVIEDMSKPIGSRAMKIKLSTIVNNGTGGTPTQTQLASPVLTLTVVSSTQINASWTSVTNATSYIVELSTSSSFTSVTALTPSGTTANATGLTASTLYYFRVKAQATNYIDSQYGMSNATTNNITSTSSYVDDGYVEPNYTE